MDKDDFRFFGFILGLFLCILMFVIFPIAWFDGHAKSSFIKKTQGIDVPWYEATFLHVEVTNNNVKIEQK